MRSIFLQIIIVAFLGISSWYVWENWGTIIGNNASDANSKKSDRPPTSVDAGTVRKDNIIVNLEVVGNLKASNAVEITTESSGIIKSIEFIEGEIVQKDQTLLILDYKIEQAKLDNAIAQTSLNKLELNRLEKIKDSPSFEVEAARAFLANSQALSDLNHLELSRLEEIKDLPSFEVEAAKAALENAKAITNLNKFKLDRLESLKTSPAFNVSKFEDLKNEMVALKANVAMAEANLNIAIQNEKLANYKARYEDLKSKNIALIANVAMAKAKLNITLQNDKLTNYNARYEDIQSKVNALLANEEIARANLRKKIIKAPFNGIVGLKKISEGEYLEPGEVATTLDAINPIELDFEVPESAISTLGLQTEITAYTRAWGEESFIGKIKSIDSRVSKESRSITVRAEIENSRQKLKPGMFMIVKLPIFNRENAIIVPEEAIISDGTQRTVYVIEDGIAKAQNVKLGERLLGEVEVTEGLSENSKVIIGGIQKVRDGSKVTIRNKEINQ